MMGAPTKIGNQETLSPVRNPAGSGLARVSVS